MKLEKIAGAAALAALITLGADIEEARAAVPSRVAFTGALNDAAGPYNGAVDMSFGLYTTAQGGSPIWSELHNNVGVSDGVLIVELGSDQALDEAIFDGGTLYLEVTVDGQVLGPRSTIAAVPYAMRATEADAVGGLTASDLQQRITGSCNAGEAIAGINVDGTVMCIATGDVTDVIAGSGLTGGGSSGAVTLGIGSGAITSAHLAANSVTASAIASDAVTASEIASSAVGSSEIATDAVGASEIAADAVGASEIASGAVRLSELAGTEHVIRQGPSGCDFLLTTATSCKTKVCGGGGVAPNLWATCSGTCGAGSQQTCSTTVIGYLIDDAMPQ